MYSVPIVTPSLTCSGTATTRNVDPFTRATPSNALPPLRLDSAIGRPRGQRSLSRPAAASVTWCMSTSTMASDSMRAATLSSSRSMVSSSCSFTMLPPVCSSAW